MSRRLDPLEEMDGNCGGNQDLEERRSGFLLARSHGFNTGNHWEHHPAPARGREQERDPCVIMERKRLTIDRWVLLAGIKVGALELGLLLELCIKSKPQKVRQPLLKRVGSIAGDALVFSLNVLGVS